ncbi:hypothetical protein HK405_001779, partial [Cladochytrium tenue]
MPSRCPTPRRRSQSAAEIRRYEDDDEFIYNAEPVGTPQRASQPAPRPASAALYRAKTTSQRRLEAELEERRARERIELASKFRATPG